MVFESVVADLLNRFLGDYVENLDRSQLQIGIFGGDVVLQDLILKQSALDDLNLPVRTVYGHLGKLVLKIPWRNLYSAPVIASIERLFLLVVPNQEIKYDAEKEEKWKQDAKQAELQRIEEAKKLERGKDKEKLPSTFTEKLAAQIIKNVQVYIHDIHIRYEDRYTCPQRPFSVGVTLHNLSVHSTDDKWNECIVQDDSPMFYKVLVLECLAVYWNCKTRSFPDSAGDHKALLTEFQDSICSKEKAPRGFSYMLGPINSSAKLRINPKPEQDGSNFSIPKMLLDFALEKLSVGVSKEQYQDLIELLESMDRMNRAAQYRKYRPHLNSYRGHYKQWWKFAYQCVLEEEVRRRRRNWNWEHMKAHRMLCRQYAELYNAKLTKGSKLPTDQQAALDRCEKELELTNIVIIRQRVEVEAERILAAKKQAQKQQSWFGGFSWWGSSPKLEEDTLSAAAIAKKFEDAMTPEEKAKLFRAIDYQENAAPPQYPVEFVELSAQFTLGSLQVEVRDDAYTTPRVMLADLAGVSVSLKRRPAAQALKVDVAVGQFTVFGLDTGEQRPQLISSTNLAGGKVALLDVLFETNPLDGRCDQRIHVSSRPLQVVYDASTINKLADVFKPPAESNAISQLQAAAESRLSELKEMSATGLQYAIEKHTVLDLKVDFMASYILIPYSGTYRGNEDLLVLDLGSFTMASITRDPSSKQTVQELHSQGTAEEEIMQAILSQSYDKFKIELKDVQILVALAGEPWKDVVDKNDKSSVMHLLHPTTLQVNLDKCLITDDPRLPKLKVSAQLPSVSLNVTDMRLLHLMAIFASIPFPTEEEIPAPIQETGSRSSSTSAVAKYLEFEARKPRPRDDSKVPSDELVQAIDMEVKFVMKEFVMSMYNQLNMMEPESDASGNGETAQKLFTFRMLHLEFEMVDQTFDKTVMLRLGGLAFDLNDPVSGSVRVLDTPMTAGELEYLLTVKYTSVDRLSPELHTKHGSVLQLVAISFTRLTVLLHQEGLAAFLEYLQRLQAVLERTQERAARASGKLPSRPADAGKLETIAEDEEMKPVALPKPSSAKRSRRTTHVIETIDFKVTASMHNLEVRVTCRARPLASAALLGVDATMAVKKSYKEIIAHLRNITVNDPNPESSHSQILSVVGEEALSARVVIFDLDEAVDTSDKVDMSVRVSMACVKVVFLNWFVTTMLNFLSSFQQAQQSIIDAAHDAAEAAKQNVQQAYTKAVRISLDIDLQAPIVIVPTNSKSADAIMLDFGKLSIKNKFHNITTEDKSGHVAVIDDIRLGLVDLKVARVALDISVDKIVRECVLLQPISLVLAVKRNLSAGWYKNVPDLELQGRLDTVQVTLSQEDYRMVMRVLTGNLAEGQPEQPKQTVKSKQSQTDWESGGTSRMDQRPTTLNVPQIYQKPSVSDSQAEAEAETATVTTSLKFTFTMENLIIDLYTGGLKALDGPDSPLRCDNAGLARFTLHVLSLKGHIRSDGCIAVSALLVDCMLDDTRFGREKALTRLMQRKRGTAPEASPVKSGSPARGTPPTEGAFRSMLDLTYQQKDGDSFVDVRVFGFDLVVCLDYLMKVGDFFTSGMAQAQDEVTGSSATPSTADGPLPATVTSRTSRSSIAKQSRTSTSLQGVPTPMQQVSAGESPPKPGMMTVNIHVEMPDIILVESMDTVDTNAIIMNNEISFKLRMSDTHLVITGGIKDLQLYSCCYSPDKRKDTMQQILRPCSITLAGSTPEGQGLHLDLTVTDIRLGVSPATIELLTKVQAALTASATKQDESEEKEADYSDLWTAKPFKDTDHWFLITEEGEDAVAALSGESIVAPVVPEEKPVKNEICVISAPSIVITVEAGIGTRTLPMILLEMGFQGEARNWSSQLYVDSNLSVQMAYYNSYLALWEPLIEPVEVLKDGKLSHALWELRAEVSMNAAEPVQTPASSEDVEELPFQPPAMTIDITSKDNLELTVSKTCLEVFSNLGKAFQSAVSGSCHPRQEQTPPFMVRNDTGLTVTLMLEDGPFQVVGQPGPDGYRQAMLESGAVACLCLQSGEEPTTLSGKLCLVPVGSAAATPDRQGGAPSARDRMLTVKVRVLDRDCILRLPVVRADKRYFPLNHRGESNDPWGIVSEVTVDDSSTIVTLRSILQVYNHFSEPVDVYYMTRRGNEVERVGTVQAGRPLNLPLYAIYTPTNELFFSVKGYTVSVIPFVWKELQNMLTHSKMLQCEPKDKKDKDPFFMKIVGELEQVYFEQTSRHTVASSCYNIYLRPAVMLKNLLPVDIICCLAGTAKETRLKPGHRAQVATAEPGSSVIIIRIPEYLEKEWMAKHEVQANPPEFAVWTFDSYDSVQKVSMDLGIHTVHKNGSLVMSLYCPFWMLNKTGMMLSYRKSRKTEKNESSGSPLKQSDETTNVLYHPDDFKGPILFSFRAKAFFGKKKASVKVEDGEWSDKFSLDVAGSSGVVNCKYGDTVYQIGVHIQLTYSGLTKQVTFTPYFVLINETKFLVECQEAERTADPWTKVKPGECSALWPRSPSNGDRKLRLRVPEQSGMTAPFSIGTVHTTLLRINNKYGGVNVDVQITEGAAYVKFTPYEPGMAPALIINHTREPIKFTEKGCKESRTLKPHEQVMFTWEDPAGARELLWTSPKKKEISVDLRKDAIDRTQLADNTELWWVSFLDGLQRILLFTEDMAIATACQAAGELEPFDREIKLSVHGVGLSLVNNVARTEVMYLGIASSGVIWETCKWNGRRFKPLSVRDGASLELAYQRYLQEAAVGQQPPTSVLVDGKVEVDFKAEEMLRPSRRRLRRTYHTGLWMQLRTSPHQTQLHAKINRLQIDNQMFDCMFPVVLAPVPPPRSVAADNALKPFAEVSIVQRIMERSPVQQFKYFKVLIQEFHIKLDLGFINSLIQLFMADELSDAQEAEQFAADLKVVEEPLQSHVSMQSSQEQKNFYDLLHFSPLKVHLSFSLSGGDSGSNQPTQTPLFLNVLLQSLGVTVTDMQDVVFKLAYFERQYTFLTQRQLVSEAMSHYVGQTLKQIYVLVLGLDVLGNPYGLVVGLTQGVEDLFYEPFQGAIQGPGEFAEGLVLGVRSLFGHTVGGAAGAVSRITGAMGKGLAALTFDKEYQRKRREALQQRAPNVQTGLAQSGKGLVMGVVDGVTGVFTKPISGAREEGVEGFFKGVGKGMVGLVTRPTAGVIDFASGSLDAVKRATEVGDEVLRLRPPRFFRPDGLLRPYIREEAEGNKLLQEVEKNKYASTDTYVAHMTIEKDVVLLTDKRIMYIVHDLFGAWQVEWGYPWEILAEPRLIEKGLLICSAGAHKKLRTFFSSKDRGQMLLIKEPERRQWLLNKITEMIKK
ncbi:LOW QUALITY PROTEIN: intermembrane lipid transfer protein Vps13-like [Schistocerca gregaria]|uniref:LOW QUALITY PROTEIN: intermembrane lipid transfer protein Vps13-like n=1 Tax=Schistocerca gregaria TaxID=7010 RepID=UPI00211E1B20|nr:LOW QUALITY PROTEIN: intermembrane lipid transfer protein Vps13-like [Schistocerca gregaria]